MIPRVVRQHLQETDPAPLRVDWNSHLESLPCPTWIGESNGESVHTNLAYRRLLGVVDPQELAELGWEEHLHPDDRKRYVKAWDLFVSGFRERLEELVRWIRPDTGETITLAVKAQRLAGGQFQGWVRLAQAERPNLSSVTKPENDDVSVSGSKSEVRSRRWIWTLLNRLKGAARAYR